MSNCEKCSTSFSLDHNCAEDEDEPDIPEPMTDVLHHTRWDAYKAGQDRWAFIYGPYRYALGRIVSGIKPVDMDRIPLNTLAVISLNPSKADHRIDDPTIRRDMNFARDWGFDELIKVNLFPYRATDPKVLTGHYTAWNDPINEEALIWAMGRANLTLAAWGVGGKLFDAGRQMYRKAIQWGHELHAIGVTKDGHPRHPLYMPKTANPVLWRGEPS